MHLDKASSVSYVSNTQWSPFATLYWFQKLFKSNLHLMSSYLNPPSSNSEWYWRRYWNQDRKGIWWIWSNPNLHELRLIGSVNPASLHTANKSLSAFFKLSSVTRPARRIPADTRVKPPSEASWAALSAKRFSLVAGTWYGRCSLSCGGINLLKHRKMGEIIFLIPKFPIQKGFAIETRDSIS